MGRSQHSFVKRQLELEKKRKAEDKRARRAERKKQKGEAHSPEEDSALDQQAAVSAEDGCGSSA